MATISCGKGNIIDPVGTDRCSKTADEYTTALTAWSSDINNKAKCEAVKKSLTAIIKDCSVYTAAQRKIYEDQLKDFTCD
ncbi:MAG: hypothetical protein U5M51_08385 [Emticicia sp.]|nr:hypothetical protein [Emticicia sp.]